MRSQFERERADRDRCRTFLFKGENCIGSGKNEKSAPIVIGMELRSQLWDWARQSGGNLDETILAQPKFCSGRRTFPEISTRRGHNSQPAPSQTQKIPGVTCRYRGNFGDYRGVLREHIPRTLGVNPGSFRGFFGQNLNNCRLTKRLEPYSHK